MEYQVFEGLYIPPGVSDTRWVRCGAGKKALGGGASATPAYNASVSQSAPLNGGTYWEVTYRNTSSTAGTTIYAWVICANVS